MAVFTRTHSRTVNSQWSNNLGSLLCGRVNDTTRVIILFTWHIHMMHSPINSPRLRCTVWEKLQIIKMGKPEHCCGSEKVSFWLQSVLIIIIIIKSENFLRGVLIEMLFRYGDILYSRMCATMLCVCGEGKRKHLYKVLYAPKGWIMLQERFEKFLWPF